jgi:uncharacterized alkaline shock family protein YloU
MLKVKTTDGLIVLGIDAENVKRLKDNQPIRVKGDELQIDHDIYIVYGETIQDITQKMGIAGVQ